MKEVGKAQTDCEVRFRLPVFDPGNVFLVAFQGRSKRFLCLILHLAVRLDVVSEYLVTYSEEIICSEYSIVNF